MELTLEIFLAIFIPVSSAIFGLLYWIHSDVRKIVEPITTASKWLQERGLQDIFKDISSEKGKLHSLSPEEEGRRDELLELGRTRGLSEEERAELEKLLRKDAQTDFAEGVISFIVFLGIMVMIAALVSALTRK